MEGGGGSYKARKMKKEVEKNERQGPDKKTFLESIAHEGRKT